MIMVWFRIRLPLFFRIGLLEVWGKFHVNISTKRAIHIITVILHRESHNRLNS
jgi:hypothetical protein